MILVSWFISMWALLPYMPDGHEMIHSFFFIRTFLIRTSKLRFASILRTCYEHTQAEILLRNSLPCLHIFVK